MYKNVIKRLIDIIISLMLIPFILILIIPVALFIKLEDHGDVFYNAERYGCLLYTTPSQRDMTVSSKP